jgi:hypothetical protein
MTSQWQQPDVPQYGEYAPAGQTPPPVQPQVQQPVEPQGPYYVTPPEVRKPRTGDVVATSILLTVGLFATLITVLIAVELPKSLAQEYSRYGIAYRQASDYGVLVGVLIISHVILYLVTVGVSIPLMIKRHLTFWVPLMTGIVAAIVFWAVLIGLLFGDGRLLQAIQAGQ